VKKTWLLCLALLCLGACAVEEIITAEETQLIVAEAPPDEALLLDIGISEFVDGVPEGNDPEDTGIYAEIRSAEARYLPYHLKNTLQGTGHWGAVRVVPSQSAYTDILVSGEIKESDGEFVEIDISVADARGRRWFSKTYAAQTGLSSYSENRDRRQDPYQKVFNDVANDLRIFVKTLPPGDIRELRQVAELKFFADMSPLAYGEHLAKNEKGEISIVRLPAENDPSVDRLRQIRERDRLVVDTLNEHYANFYYGIAIPYHSWRKVTREESINYRQVKRSAMMQTLIGAVVIAGSLAANTSDSSRSQQRMKGQLQNIAIGQGIEAMISGFTRVSESKIHIESIRELSESFGAEAAPMVVTVEGETRQLTGTAAAQYESWRRLLKDIYEAETGFVETVEVSRPVRVPEPAG